MAGLDCCPGAARCGGVRWLPIGVALAAALLAGEARAREIETGLPDLQLRFDNTLRYNIGVRTDPVDAKVASNPAFSAGESSIAQGGLTANRLDLLSEIDVSYAGRFGGRLSGAGWFDAAYGDAQARRSPALAQIPGTYVGNDFSAYTRHRYRGPWGELLDAFVFARFDAGGVPVAVNAGRHTLYWGESLMLPGVTHGIAYSQMPLDLQKGYATPGVEAKELFRPLANVSVSAQVTPTIALAAQYFVEWDSYLYPEGGTFLGGGDFAFNGPDGIFRPLGGAPAYLRNAGVAEPKQVGDWGVAARWTPELLDATLGLYYRRYTDKVAAVLLSPNPGGVGPLSPGVASPLQYQQYYAEGVDLVGLSFAKQIGGVSVGAETSFRHDTPLLAQSLGFVVAPAPPLAPVLFPNAAPRLEGNSYQARGDTLHALVNAVAVLPRTALFSTASVAVELTHSRWLTVGSNRDMFYGEGYGVCRSDAALSAAGLAKTSRDGCATRGHLGVSAGFTPTWYRVASGLDLLAPVSLSWTISGNSPVMLGGNERSGTYGVGVAADYRNRYRFELRYVDYFGQTTEDATTMTSMNGLLAVLQHRGSVTLTAKATF